MIFKTVQTTRRRSKSKQKEKAKGLTNRRNFGEQKTKTKWFGYFYIDLVKIPTEEEQLQVYNKGKQLYTHIYIKMSW